MQQPLSNLTDAELLAKAKSIKTNKIIRAVLIGFLAGVVAYSIWAKSIGVFTVIPLFFIIKLKKDDAVDKEVQQLLKERNLA